MQLEAWILPGTHGFRAPSNPKKYADLEKASFKLGSRLGPRMGLRMAGAYSYFVRPFVDSDFYPVLFIRQSQLSDGRLAGLHGVVNAPCRNKWARTHSSIQMGRPHQHNVSGIAIAVR